VTFVFKTVSFLSRGFTRRRRGPAGFRGPEDFTQASQLGEQSFPVGDYPLGSGPEFA
jgi:hypothetical protein